MVDEGVEDKEIIVDVRKAIDKRSMIPVYLLDKDHVCFDCRVPEECRFLSSKLGYGGAIGGAEKSARVPSEE